jgi:hypothetical protein
MTCSLFVAVLVAMWRGEEDDVCVQGDRARSKRPLFYILAKVDSRNKGRHTMPSVINNTRHFRLSVAFAISLLFSLATLVSPSKSISTVLGSVKLYRKTGCCSDGERGMLHTLSHRLK